MGRTGRMVEKERLITVLHALDEALAIHNPVLV
jgi:hypothetical protein